MRPIQLTNATRRLGAPVNWDHSKDGICHTLDVCDLGGYMISAWVPSENELKRLNEGKPIFLEIQGTRHPVVSLKVSD